MALSLILIIMLSLNMETNIYLYDNESLATTVAKTRKLVKRVSLYDNNIKEKTWNEKIDKAIKDTVEKGEFCVLEDIYEIRKPLLEIEVAHKEVADAMIELCNYYTDGDSENYNPNKAFTLYRKASSLGSIIGTYHLGDCYFYGKGVKKDTKKAFDSYIKVALKHSGAAYMTSYIYIESKNNEKALKYMIISAELGNATAMYTLGTFYEEGKIVKEDMSEAIKWFQKASSNGYKLAQKKLESL